jgi:hypothetical protein
MNLGIDIDLTIDQDPDGFRKLDNAHNTVYPSNSIPGYIDQATSVS